MEVASRQSGIYFFRSETFSRGLHFFLDGNCMKSYVCVLIALSGVLLFGLHHDSLKARDMGRRPAVQSSCRLVRVDVEGLTPQRIDKARKAFLSVPGVHSVEFRPKGKEAVVDFDITVTNLKSIQRALQSAGFTPYFH